MLRHRLEALPTLPPLRGGLLRVMVDQDARVLLTGEHSELTGESALPGSALLADQSEDLHLLNSTGKDILTYKGHAPKRFEILLANSPGQNPCGKICSHYGTRLDKNRMLVLSYSTITHNTTRS